MKPYVVRSPVLFLIFNRPDTTRKVFEKIREAKPSRLYVAADGPRLTVPGDNALCAEARQIIQQVDWACELKTLFREENAGCRNGVSAAIAWFFENEEEGIILEDDCLPANSFFYFCDELLEKYRGDTQIKVITGCNLQQGKKWGTATYYFSNRVHVWGWASWKRVWNDYDANLEKYGEAEVRAQMLKIYGDPLVADSWIEVFNGLKAGTVNSWAYPLDFSVFLSNGLVIIPNENLISNIGFGSNATNLTSTKSIFDHLPLSEIDDITHPNFIAPAKQADLFIINHNFNMEERRRKQNSPMYKLKKWFSEMRKYDS